MKTNRPEWLTPETTQLLDFVEAHSEAFEEAFSSPNFAVIVGDICRAFKESMPIPGVVVAEGLTSAMITSFALGYYTKTCELEAATTKRLLEDLGA